MKMQHLAQFKIAGFSYYEGAFVFRKLKIVKIYFSGNFY